MTTREIFEATATAVVVIALFFGLCWLAEQAPEEPEPPQAAEFRALLDAKQQEREFKAWRESQSRQFHQLAQKGETK